jgi:hypothetical protein
LGCHDSDLEQAQTTEIKKKEKKLVMHVQNKLEVLQHAILLQLIQQGHQMHFRTKEW